MTVRIRSGTVPTPVRVKATLAGTTISTVSSNLSVAVGLPSQLNFSLSQGARNIEGYNIDGTSNTYKIIASDRLANPVPSGTSINFVSEGGQVEAIRQTTVSNGLASATSQFQSSDPRPGNGRITVVAYALGEESFLDTDGDNVYDSGEYFQDLGDIFLSRRYSKTYEAGKDQYISLDITGSAACVNAPASYPGNVLGLNQTTPSVGGSTCDGTWGRAYVRRAAETVLSSSASRLMWYREAAGLLDSSTVASGTKIDSGCTTYEVFTTNNDVDYVTQIDDPALEAKKAAAPDAYKKTFFLMGSGGLYNMPDQGSLSFVVSDTNPIRLNPMAAATTVTVSATTGISATVGGGSPVPDSSTATSAVVAYKFTDTSSGTLFITTRSPSGLGTTFAVNITTDVAPVSGSACTQ